MDKQWEKPSGKIKSESRNGNTYKTENNNQLKLEKHN